MDKKVYRISVGQSGELPFDSADCDNLQDMRQYVSDTIQGFKDNDDCAYNRWENLWRLRRSHFVHAGGVGITVGILTNERYNVYITVAYVDESL